MTFSALTIDTNVAYGNSFDFEQGLVGQLSQFAASDAKFLISDVVRRELLKRLREMTRASRDKFINGAQESLQRSVLPAANAAAVETLIAAVVDSRVAADTRLNQFLAATGAVVVEPELGSMNELTRRYFEGEAPFAGAKKSEFPDAIALLSLEAWGRQHGKVLAVSMDSDWKAFAKSSRFIEVVDDLAGALAIFQEQATAEAAAAAVSTLLDRITAGELPDLEAQFASRLESRAEELEISPEANSYYEFEPELTGVVFQSYALIRNPKHGFDITVVRLDGETTVVTFPVKVTVSVHATFSLQKFDSIDRDYVDLGSQDQEKEVEFFAKALVTFDGQLEDPSDLEIDDVELIDAIDEVDFGELELDYGYEE